MKILGIETAALICGAAIVVDGNIISEEQTSEKKVHAENIMRLVDASLSKAGVTLKDLDAIAISIGPGSFTGLRIGLSVAKGFAYAMDKPLVAVSTLDALARRAVDAGVVKTPYILSALDARRDEVFCRLFRMDENKILPEWLARDLTLHDLFDELGDLGVSVTGDAIAKIQSFDHMKKVVYVPDEIAMCSAATVAIIGEELANNGDFVDPVSIEPAYVKEFYSPQPG